MAYVALSRVQTLQGVALLGLVDKKITLSAAAKDEMERFKKFQATLDDDVYFWDIQRTVLWCFHYNSMS